MRISSASGALGLAHAVKASLMGAGRIIAVDSSRRRLDLAARRRCGRRKRGVATAGELDPARARVLAALMSRGA